MGKWCDRGDIRVDTTHLSFYSVYSGVGSNRVLQGPPIQVVGVALITEFCDHNYSFVEVVFQ